MTAHAANPERTRTANASVASAVEINGLQKWYGAFHALRNIDLSIAEGSRVIVCGPSGSGKSTLIRCINGLEAYQSGAIRIGGSRLGLSPSKDVEARSATGMVFQNFNLFPHLSVLSNCTLALRRVQGKSRAEAEAVARHFLDKVHIGQLADRYPRQLSGGQQQRVAIARALCLEPRLMLFDEPTSALDPEMIKEVLDVMVALADEGMTMVCVTHEMGFARQVADEVVFMDAGSIIERARPDEFFARPQHPRTRIFLSQILH